MDFQQFGIDARILEGASGLQSRALFHEKMLIHAVQNRENVCAKISVETGRDAIVLLPALQWLATNAGGRALVLSPDRKAAERLAAAARELGSGLSLETCVVTPGEEGSAGGSTLEGSPSASLVVGSPDALLGAEASGLLRLSDFGYLLVDEAEILAELPEELLRKISSALKPASERRSLVACAKISTKAKNLAWDLADNPVEIRIEEEEAKGQSVASETWLISTEEKLRFLLGILARERPTAVCVFCNLKGSAEELSLRLDYNGVESDYLLGALAQERKLEILSRLKEEAGGVLVLTDEGSAGLPSGRFPLVVNFDIPLEPELYVKRLEMLDRGHPGAKVVNLACDRYLYGLPAVEQHIGAKLESRQVTEDLLRAEDKSAALAFEKPSSDRGHRGPHTGRLVPVGGPQARRDERPKGEERSGGNQERRREGGQGRDSRRRRGGRDEDRSPEIRQSIAELTGSAPLSAPRPDAGNRQQPKTSSDRGSSGRVKAEGRRGGGEGKNKGRDQRASSSRPASGRGNSQKSQRRGPAPQGHADANDNPYELPMEERMKRYREKYGQRLESSDQRPGKGGQNHEGKRLQAQDGHSKQQHGGAPRQGANGQQSRRPQQGPRPAPQSPASGKPAVGKPAAGNPAKPQRQGFLGKIRGLFGK